MIVCFCGIDGSGKSTQAELIRKHDGTIEYVHLFSNNSSTMAKVHNTSFVSSILGFLRKKKDNIIIRYVLLFLRLLNLFIDNWLTHYRYKNSDATILFDRYYYDILVIIASDYNKYSRIILRFTYLLPTPAKIIFFSIEPEISFARKKESNLERLTIQNDLYQVLSQMVNTSSLIDTNNDELRISQNIVKFIFGK